MKLFKIRLIIIFVMLFFAIIPGQSSRILSIDEIDRLYVKNADKALQEIQKLGSYCEKTNWKSCPRSKFNIVYCCICRYKQMAPQNLHYAFAALENSILERNVFYQLMALQFISEIYFEQGNYYKSGQYIQKMSAVAGNNPKWMFYQAMAKIYKGEVALKSKKNLKVVFKYFDEADNLYNNSCNPKVDRYLIRWGTLQERFSALIERKRYASAYYYLKISEQYLKDLKYKAHVKKIDVWMDDAAFDLRLMNVYSSLCLPAYQLGRKKEAEIYFKKAMETQIHYANEISTTMALANYLEESQQWERLNRFLDSYANFKGKDLLTLELMRKNLKAYLHLNDQKGATRMFNQVSALLDTITKRNDLYADEELRAVEKINKMKSTINHQQTAISKRNHIVILFVCILALLIASLIVIMHYNIQQRRKNRKLFEQIKKENEERNRLDNMTIETKSDEDNQTTKSTFEADNIYCKKDYQDFANNIKHYLGNKEVFSDKDLTPETIANHFNVSRQFMDRVMKEFMGMTVYDFVTEKRLLHSCDLLEKTNDIIYTVAINSGFGSERTFLRIFKNKYDMSPTKYRKISQEKK